MLEITVLGIPQIKLDAQRITTFESRTAEAVLYYLAVTGRIHSRETLAEFFWSERSQAQSLSNLRTVLHRLRRVLEPYFDITRSTVVLQRNAGVWIDAVDVLQILNETDVHHLTAISATRLEQALMNYRGAFLDGFFLRDCVDFENWTLTMREMLQIRVTDTLDALIEYYLQNNMHVPAIAQVERLIKIDPLREQSYALKMRLLADLGQRDRAIEVYHHLTVLLHSELAISPSVELQRLYKQLHPQESARNVMQRLALDLATLTQRWLEVERHSDYLATGKPLEKLETLLAGKVILSDIERTFIEMSLEQRDLREVAEQARENEATAIQLSVEATQILDRGGTGEVAGLLAIRSLELSYTASADAALLRALQKPLLKQRFSGHDFRTVTIITSTDGHYLLSAGADKTLRLWDLNTGKTLRVISDFDVPIRSATFSPDSKYYAVGCSGNTLRIWGVDHSEPVRILRSHTGCVQCVAWSQDGQLLASGDTEGVVYIWQAQTGDVIQAFKLEVPIEQVYFAEDRPAIFVVTADTVTVWNVEVRNRFQIIETGSHRITAFLSVPDSNHVLIGTHNGNIQLWDCSNERMIKMLKAETTAVIALWIEDQQIIALHKNGQMWAWQLEEELPLWTKTYPEEIQTVARSANNQSLFIGGSPNADFSSFVWRKPKEGEPRVLAGHRGWVTAAVFSPDNVLIASSSWDSTVRLWEVASGRVVRVLKHPEGHALKAVTFAPDGRSVVSSCDDGIARCWDVETGELLQMYEGHSSAVTGVAFSSDHNFVLTGSHDQTLRLWDAYSGTQIQCFTGHKGAVFRVKFSPDNRLVLSPSADQTVRLWDLRTHEVVRTFSGHTGWVTGTAFSPEGRYLVTTSFDQTARLWHVETGECVRVFSGHTAPVRHTAFSSDGRLIATGSEDRSMRLWDVATGKQVRVFTGHEDGLWQMDFSPDGRTIVSASADRTIRIWRVRLSDVIDLAREILPGQLSSSELSEYGSPTRQIAPQIE
ncbi:MAG: BTAD domain-containing putative transcriptional regulator [Aggregatilineales bacterium]